MAKRALSDSDCDDLFSDHKSSCLTPPESCGHQGVTRKKRRGIIEKRRRDRINNSLTELRRLVPTAFEKQGSAKLEKAEILQMTVDHLKMIHAKGFDAFAYDPQKYLMDYHTVGFRECIRETTVYLQSEGMDSHDPLCQRLMSHLHGALTQRELANKQAAASSWTLATPNYSLPHHNLNATNTGPPPQQSSLMEPSEQYMTTNTNIHMDHHHQPLQRYHQLNHTISSSPQERNPGGGYGLTPYAFPNQNTSNNSSPIYVPNGKPYRPWGAELAY